MTPKYLVGGGVVIAATAVLVVAIVTAEKKSTPPVPVTAEEKKWFDEMVKAGVYKPGELDGWKELTPAQRKEYYEAFRKK